MLKQQNRRSDLVEQIASAAVDVMAFINIGYDLGRTYRRVKIKIAHISVIICTDYYSDCICTFLEQW